MGEKPERKSKREQKKNPFTYPPTPPSVKRRPTVFRFKGIENKPDLP